MRTRATALAILLIAVLVAACGGSAAPSTGGGFITIKNVWVRAAAADGMSAAYFTIVNGQVAADSLVAVSSSAAGMVTIHETKADPSGMMGMSPVASVDLPGGGTVEFKPGGYHVMLEKLTKELKVGDQVPLVLTFKLTGPINATAEVRAN